MTSIPCLVFAKPPRRGMSKTRLAQGIGDAAAEAIAAAMLQDTWATVSSVPSLLPILATPEPTSEHGLGPVRCWDQGDGALGRRLERMFRRALAAGRAAIAIGADAPGVPQQHYLQAVEALQAHDAVLGASEDGGFYLLGLTRCPEGLLDEIPWSDPDTCRHTCRRLLAAGLGPARLPVARDVDHEADLRWLRRSVPREQAPRTHAVIDTLAGWPEAVG